MEDWSSCQRGIVDLQLVEVIQLSNGPIILRAVLHFGFGHRFTVQLNVLLDKGRDLTSGIPTYRVNRLDDVPRFGET